MARSREQNREYMRKYRASRAAAMSDGATVIRIRRNDSVEAAVLEEIEALPLASKRPAEVAAALAMARILDDPGSVPQQAPAVARLREILKDLRGEVEGGKSKLATLRAIRGER